MPKVAKELSALEVKRLSTSGWHAVGGVAGLLLQIRTSDDTGSVISKSWVLRVRIGGNRIVTGLGPYPEVSVAEARIAAKKLTTEVRNGVNPLARRRAEKSALLAASSKQKTFQQCAVAYMEAHASDYSNEKHRKQWVSTLESYAYPVIGKMIVADISMRNILDVLLQDTAHRNGSKGKMWYTKTETAKRLLDRIRTILDYATVNEYRSGTNPATWKGYLDTQLPSPRGLKTTRHYPAIPYDQIGDFIVSLRQRDGISARALEFLILTGVRSKSVRLAEWSEIDFNRSLWIIPADHTKAKREHRVPLQRQAICLLKMQPRTAGLKFVFPSPRGKALADMALSQLMRRMQQEDILRIEAVPHGFRSTFRDWAAEQTNYPDEIRKAASGHAVGDAVKEAYQRTDLLEKRRRLMNEWANFLDSPSTTNLMKVTKKKRQNRERQTASKP